MQTRQESRRKPHEWWSISAEVQVYASTGIASSTMCKSASVWVRFVFVGNANWWGACAPRWSIPSALSLVTSAELVCGEGEDVV